MATDILPNLHRLGAAASDIALFNYGAWHNDESSMQGNASLLEAYLVDNLDRLPFLGWREVAPQHFDTPLGEYSCSGCPEATTPFVCKVRLLQLHFLQAPPSLGSKAPNYRACGCCWACILSTRLACFVTGHAAFSAAARHQPTKQV